MDPTVARSFIGSFTQHKPIAPDAIDPVGGKPVLVQIDDALRLDLTDLDAKITSSGVRFLLLSHMRGHLCDMDRLMRICDTADVTVIEDCAHTMGARWNGRRSGSFGKVACFSTQTYKHINSGEGGFLTTGNTDVAARATILSGSYMMYDRHGADPATEAFATARYQMPNCSARMDVLCAAILCAQLARRLQKAGATARRIPCNTAHHYASQIWGAVSIPLLNMVDQTVARAAQSVNKGAGIGMLASPAVRLAGVFDPALEQAGLGALWLRDAARELADKGAALLLVACSEFSLTASKLSATLPVIDTIDVLADAIHDHSQMKSS